MIARALHLVHEQTAHELQGKGRDDPWAGAATASQQRRKDAARRNAALPGVLLSSWFPMSSSDGCDSASAAKQGEGGGGGWGGGGGERPWKTFCRAERNDQPGTAMLLLCTRDEGN